MATALRPIGHEDRLSLVDHLAELRTRLIISLLALVVAFGVSFWQNHALLHLINKPLEKQTEKQVKAGHSLNGATFQLQQTSHDVAVRTQQVIQALQSSGSGLSPQTQVALRPLESALQRDINTLAKPAAGDRPVTLGIGEPFTTTVTIALLFALIFALPVILYELYGFILPAFSPNERRVALPALLAVPLLFVVGVVFGYYVVLPAAVRFFQNFNSSQFNVLVQANQYYRFAAITLLAMGLFFQVPVAILGATSSGIVTTRQLRKNRRYALVLCAAVAAFLPGDAITLALETVPLYALFEVSILIASVVERRQRRRAMAEAQERGPSVAPPAPPAGA